MWTLIASGFFFHLLISLDTYELGVNNFCVTINQENGTCESLLKCGLTIETILGSEEAYDFAKNSKCGSGFSTVCCGPAGYTKISRLIILTTPPPEEEKIQIHRFSDSSICGKHAASNKVKGGVLVEFEEFPWLAGLEYVSNYDHENKGIRCGGSLLNERFVLTAAHCIIHHELVLVKVWLGATNISSDGKNCLNVTGDNHCVDSIQKFNIKKTVPHPFYKAREYINDIGLIELEDSVKFSSFVRPICLRPKNSLPLRIHSYLTVCGWGATENRISSDIKLKTDLPLQNNSACNQLWPWEDSKVNSEQLCVGGEIGKDSCQGDSGGPLMKKYRNAIGDIQWVQVGIVSYGNGCGVRGRPAVYVNVDSYADWVGNIISGIPYVCTSEKKRSSKRVPKSVYEDFVAAIQKVNSKPIITKHSQCGYESELLVCCDFTVQNENNATEQNENSSTVPPDVLFPGDRFSDELPVWEDVSNTSNRPLPTSFRCGLEKDEYRELDGEVTEIGEFPWMAALEYKSKLTNQSAGIRCGGTLIHERYILTAAHCILDREFKLNEVWLGEWENSKQTNCQKVKCADMVKKLYIKEEIVHPFYNRRSGYNDIGLLRLEHDVIYTGEHNCKQNQSIRVDGVKFEACTRQHIHFIRPICLPPDDQPIPAVGTTFTIADWCTTENETHVQMKIAVPTISKSDCKTKLETGHISSNQLCVGGSPGKISCLGDLGGPLMRPYQEKVRRQAQWYQEGVVSYGLNFRIASYPVIYTRVSRYTNWIRNSIMLY